MVYGPILAFPLFHLFHDADIPFVILEKQPWGFSPVYDPSYSFIGLIILLVVAVGFASTIIAVVYFFRLKHPLLKKQAAFVMTGTNALKTNARAAVLV